MISSIRFLKFDYLNELVMLPIKPIYHQKPCLLWSLNTNKTKTNSMEYTHPTQTKPKQTTWNMHTQCKLNLRLSIQTIFRWLVLTLRQFALGPLGFLDTNMLVSVTLWLLNANQTKPKSIEYIRPTQTQPWGG